MVAVIKSISVSAGAADHMSRSKGGIAFPQITGKQKGKIRFS
jgi:hypothetical protein